MKRAPALAGLMLLLASCVAPQGGAPAVTQQKPAPGPSAPASPQPAVAAVQSPVRVEGVVQQGALLRASSRVPLAALWLDGDQVPVGPDGRFLLGFGRDAGPVAMLTGRTADGASFSQQLAVSPRQWDVQSLPTLAKGTTPTPEFLARRKAELAQIVAARGLHPATEGWRQDFIWPVTGRISTLFGSERIYAGEPGEPHSGIDIARPTGTPVASPADGVVVLAAAAPFTLEGNLLMIDHGMGLTSAFLHLSRIDVKVGDRVTQGQVIGAVGMTGRATGPHLHWGLVWQGRRVDPLLWAGPMPS